MKTAAAILIEQRRPLEIDEIELPSLSFGQVLVEIVSTRICGSQIGEIDGVKGPDHYLPHLLGHEAGGIVREIGPEVTRVKPGDHVVAHWRLSAGIQARSPKYRRGNEVVNGGSITTFNQFSVISENRLTPIPKEVSFETAALLADTLTTGFGVISRDARVQVGESVVIIGVGGIGLGAVLGAKLAGACPIVAVDLFDHKLAKAREYGADLIVKPQANRFAEQVHALMGDADVVIDGTGSPAVIAEALTLTSKRGRCVLFGVMPHDRELSLNTLQLHFGKVLTGSEGGQSRPDKDIPRYLRLMEHGRFNPAEMVSHRGSLSQINSLIDSMRNGEVIHALINF